MRSSNSFRTTTGIPDQKKRRGRAKEAALCRVPAERQDPEVIVLDNDPPRLDSRETSESFEPKRTNAGRGAMGKRGRRLDAAVGKEDFAASSLATGNAAPQRKTTSHSHDQQSKDDSTGNGGRRKDRDCSADGPDMLERTKCWNNGGSNDSLNNDIGPPLRLSFRPSPVQHRSTLVQRRDNDITR